MRNAILGNDLKNSLSRFWKFTEFQVNAIFLTVANSLTLFPGEKLFSQGLASVVILFFSLVYKPFSVKNVGSIQ